MTWLRPALVLLGTVLVLGMANLTILQKQEIVDEGRQILLRLAPADPRSLMQGDFMRLRYDPAVYPDRETVEAAPWRGVVVLTLDTDGVGRFARLDDGTPLGPYEIRVRYKLRDRFGAMRYGADSFFFQEGKAYLYSVAVYGVLRVDADGNSVLTGLARENHEVIRPGRPARR